MEIAINYPERVNKLILEASAAKNTETNHRLFSEWADNMENGQDSKEWFREAFYWLFHHKIFENPKLLEAKLNYASRYPYQQSVTAFRNQPLMT